MAEVELAEFIVIASQEPVIDSSYQWSHNDTLLLLDMYGKYRKQVGSLKIKNLKKMFEEIAREMKAKTGKNILGTNCENRWKHLERTYKKFIDNNNNTGRARRDFEYADAMHDILGKKKNITPVLVLSTETLAHNIQNVEEDIADESAVVQQPHHNPEVLQQCNGNPEVAQERRNNLVATKGRQKYASRKTKIHYLKLMREDRKEYYKKRLEQEDRRIDLLEKYLLKGNPGDIVNIL